MGKSFSENEDDFCNKKILRYLIVMTKGSEVRFGKNLLKLFPENPILTLIGLSRSGHFHLSQGTQSTLAGSYHWLVKLRSFGLLHSKYVCILPFVKLLLKKINLLQLQWRTTLQIPHSSSVVICCWR